MQITGTTEELQEFREFISSTRPTKGKHHAMKVKVLTIIDDEMKDLFFDEMI